MSFEQKMIRRETVFLIAAIPAGFLPIAYAVLVVHVLIVTVTGVGITPELGGPLWWIGTAAIWLTIAQWPFYLLWVAISPELTVRQKVAWSVVIFLGNIFAMPYFLWCKYRNNAALGLSGVASRTEFEGGRSTQMKKNIYTGILLVITLVIGLGLFYVSWGSMMWKSQALINAEFAAKVWAANDFAKGKFVQLRLVITDDPKRTDMKPTILEGPYVVREMVGYIDPLLKDTNSPSIQVAREMVEAYNATMKEMFENPEENRRRLDREIAYWQTNVLGRKNASNQPSEATSQ